MAVTNVVNFSGYGSGKAGTAGRAPSTDDPRTDDDEQGFWPLDKCVKAYTTYLDSKRLEIEEQQTARRYRHGAQWTADQIKTFNDRQAAGGDLQQDRPEDRRHCRHWLSGSSKTRRRIRARRSIRPAPTWRPRCCAI